MKLPCRVTLPASNAFDTSNGRRRLSGTALKLSVVHQFTLPASVNPGESRRDPKPFARKVLNPP